MGKNSISMVRYRVKNCLRALKLKYGSCFDIRVEPERTFIGQSGTVTAANTAHPQPPEHRALPT